jgi:hypothetical protein
MNLTRHPEGRRINVTRGRADKPFFFVLSETGLWTNLDCRNSHEASRPTAADRHPKGFYFLLRKRLCRVDVGSRVRTFPAAKAWTPTLSTSVACVPNGMLATDFAPFACAIGRHHVVSR